jgi:hypothetical protein
MLSYHGRGFVQKRAQPTAEARGKLLVARA